MTASNIDDPKVPAQATDAHVAAAKLATDATVAVIDESRRRGDSSVSLDDLTDRLAMQFHNLPGFSEEDFRARANASVKIAELSGDRGTARLDQSARKAEDKHRKG